MSLIALGMCSLFILCLFLRDRKLHPMTSRALWVPFLWISIIGSKEVSYWLGAELDAEAALASRMDGSPLDRAVFIVLIVAGTVELCRRRIDWKKIVSHNLWLVLYLLYCGISILWSDYIFISTKRYVKDLGNMVMVLVILTDRFPVRALRGVFSRYTNFVIPASLLLILFFPDIGTHQDSWSESAANIGVTTNKNELGIVLVTCGLFLLWDTLEMWKSHAPKVDLVLRGAVLVITLWLLAITGSATALVCCSLGAFLVLFQRLPFVQKQLQYVGTYALVTAALFMLLDTFPALSRSLLGMLGRDLTLTGRTEIWSGLLREPVNPLVGSGYMNFWLPPVIDRYQGITQAHNGYLETYLNCGVLGLTLLLAMIFFTGARVRRQLLRQDSYGALMFLFFVVAVVYNWTEAMFNGLSLIWFILLIAALDCPQQDPEPVLKADPGPVPFDRMAYLNRVRNRQSTRDLHGE